jgi:hypothetical protein
MEKIDILTGVNPVNYEYFFYFVDNFRKLSSGQVELNFKVLTGPARGRQELTCNQRQINAIRSKNVEVIDGNHLQGLGEALNHFVSNLNDETNVLISDIDVAMVKKNWDIESLELLKTHDVLGLPFEESSALKLGASPNNAIRPQKTPSVIWMMFKNNNPAWKNLDFTHSKDEESTISQLETSIYNIPEGFYVAKDVGWRIPKFLKQNNLSHFAMTNINRHSPLPPIIFSGISTDLPWGDGTGKSGWLCDEGVINGVPFLAHQKLSQRWQFKGSNISKVFYDTVDAYINKSYGI